MWTTLSLLLQNQHEQLLLIRCKFFLWVWTLKFNMALDKTAYYFSNLNSAHSFNYYYRACMRQTRNGSNFNEIADMHGWFDTWIVCKVYSLSCTSKLPVSSVVFEVALIRSATAWARSSLCIHSHAEMCPPPPLAVILTNVTLLQLCIDYHSHCNPSSPCGRFRYTKH